MKYKLVSPKEIVITSHAIFTPPPACLDLWILRWQGRRELGRAPRRSWASGTTGSSVLSQRWCRKHEEPSVLQVLSSSWDSGSFLWINRSQTEMEIKKSIYCGGERQTNNRTVRLFSIIQTSYSTTVEWMNLISRIFFWFFQTLFWQSSNE